MKIPGLNDMTLAELEADVHAGGRFVVYSWCASVIILTFKRPSGIYYVPAGKSRVVPGLQFCLISIVFGWWGIPWGPIHTVGSLASNLAGGRDVTEGLLAAMQEAARTETPFEALPEDPLVAM